MTEEVIRTRIKKLACIPKSKPLFVGKKRYFSFTNTRPPHSCSLLKDLRVILTNCGSEHKALLEDKCSLKLHLAAALKQLPSPGIQKRVDLLQSRLYTRDCCSITPDATVKLFIKKAKEQE